MKSKKKWKIIYSIFFVLGLCGFILQIFVFEKPDGNIGFILCLIEVGCISGSTVRLCQLSKDFKDGFLKFLKIVFRF